MMIKTEQISDIEIIAELTYRAFENHPHHAPGAKPTEHLIINRLRKANQLTLSLIYENEQGIVGHIAFSPVKINDQESNWFGLGPVSVLPEHQGKGIGSALIHEGISQIKTFNADGIVLLGEPEYYSRFGFANDPKLTLQGVPAEYFMIKAFTSEIPEGEVNYHPAFFES